MKAVLVHYHLKPGGVSTVIRHQAEALRNEADVLILSGLPAPGEFPAPVATIPSLAYDSDAGGREPPETTADAIVETTIRELGGLPDLVHVHNPLLAKNRSLPDVLMRLQHRRIPLLLQIHDLAEDGRPHLYYRDAAYPSDCHYAVINQRDRRLLVQSGLNPEAVHYLPNPVAPIAAASYPEQPEDHVLYPVRAIRRKNIGEAMLLSLFFPDRLPLSITLPPNSAADRKPYDFWRRFAAANGLNVRFEAGVDADFGQLLAGSRFVLSTSISEGFGYSFLEPWTAGKVFWGRCLPDIMTDFVSEGLRLEHLYRSIRLPAEWLESPGIRDIFRDALASACRHYGVPERLLKPDGFLDDLFQDDQVDFGLLDERIQSRFLLRLLENSGCRRRFYARHPSIAGFRPETVSERVVADNRRTVLDRFSPSGYRDLLMDIYRGVLRATVRHRIDKTTLIRGCLKPETFSLLKWRSYEA